MNVVTKLCAWIGVTALGLGLTACSSVETNSTGGGSTSSSGSGGAGQGGAAGVTTSSASSGAGGGTEFVDCPKSATSFGSGDCDILNPDCSEGKKCFPIKESNGSTTTKCVTWNGVKGLGAKCSFHEECAAGYFCAEFCTPACCPTVGVSDCDCTVKGGGFGDPNDTVWMCNYMPTCDLFVAETCSKYPGWQCHLQKAKEDLSTCSKPSLQQEPMMDGKSCSFLNDCNEMQMCQGGLCRYTCLRDSFETKGPAEGGCPDGQTCKPLQDTQKYGYCSPP